MPILALKYSKLKTKEIKARLRELKYVLEYPENWNEIKLSESIEKSINNIKPYENLPRT